MAMVEPAKHLFGQHFCPVYKGKAKSCLQLPHQKLHLRCFWAAEPPIQDSRFKIPIDLHDESTCNITQQMKVVKLVRKADLIIWDEAPMMHKQSIRSLVGKPWSLVGIFNKSYLLFPREDEKTLLVHRFLNHIFGNML